MIKPFLVAFCVIGLGLGGLYLLSNQTEPEVSLGDIEEPVQRLAQKLSHFSPPADQPSQSGPESAPPQPPSLWNQGPILGSYKKTSLSPAEQRHIRRMTRALERRLKSQLDEDNNPAEKLRLLDEFRALPPTQDVLRSCVLALMDASPAVRQAAVGILLEFNIPAAIPLLQQHLESSDSPEFVVAAESVLAALER